MMAMAESQDRRMFGFQHDASLGAFSRVSEQRSGNGADVTAREYTSGQKVFGRYTLRKILGRGGLGIVWLARDEELERAVALQFLPDIVVLDKTLLSDLKRETRCSLELVISGPEPRTEY
ncbi:hypothetical protein BH20VER1_BH20VER1_18380 [soil metagenome]|jgi:serine/threonine protein kinase